MFGTANSDPDITSDLTHTEIRKSTEYVFANGTVVFGPNIPSESEYLGFGNLRHCLVRLIGGDIMILFRNHANGNPRVYRYNPSTNTYTRQANDFLNPGGNAGNFGACSSFYSAKHGNRHVIYMGGGFNSGTFAQLLDYTVSNEWEARKF